MEIPQRGVIVPAVIPETEYRSEVKVVPQRGGLEYLGEGTWEMVERARVPGRSTSQRVGVPRGVRVPWDGWSTW